MNSDALIGLKALVSCLCNCMAMHAENMQREHTGNSPAYVSKDFFMEVNQMEGTVADAIQRVDNPR